MKKTNVELATGQIWSIMSESPTTAKVIIGRIEPWLDRTSVHVSIVDVPIPDGQPSAGGTTTFGYIPFDEAAIVASLDELLGTNATPPSLFKEGYQEWHDNGGGVFTVSIADVIELVFRGMPAVSDLFADTQLVSKLFGGKSTLGVGGRWFQRVPA